ncbi:methylmalonyl-CoA mutase subunit beta [Bizionia sediminis]|uniref:Methylmalonyl-CoA mutase subunit beta n=1 Tax=Bizionia sediminis TaxID=1737064 RepID=A0ABW5KP10_9FLAO
MTKPLFSVFPEVSSKEWKQKIQADLKGADYTETLIWQSNEGIHVKPFYHKDSQHFLANPAIPESTWQICQTIYVQQLEVANKIAVSAIKNGAESIKFIIPDPEIALSKLLKNINLEETSLFFELQSLSESFTESIKTLNKPKTVLLQHDIIGNLARSGNWFSSMDADYNTFTKLVKTSESLSVDVGLYQNAGANMVQQLAYALAHVNEYFNYLDTQLSSKQKQGLQVVFQIAVGSNYFFEIAKIRALRLLFKSVADAYGYNNTCQIFATPSKRNKTLYDYNTNMLRTTTECMSAVLGGANTVCNMPYDAIYHKNNEFGDRIARNQLLILKHESYFSEVKNPAEGSYYIESLTEQLAEKALERFKDIEANGGFLKQLKEGIIQRKINESASKEQAQFNSGELILVGTNKHPNSQDNMAHELELFPFVKNNPRKTLIAPIVEKRLAEQMEQARLNKEQAQ